MTILLVVLHFELTTWTIKYSSDKLLLLNLLTISVENNFDDFVDRRSERSDRENKRLFVIRDKDTSSTAFINNRDRYRGGCLAYRKVLLIHVCLRVEWYCIAMYKVYVSSTYSDWSMRIGCRGRCALGRDFSLLFARFQLVRPNGWWMLA